MKKLLFFSLLITLSFSAFSQKSPKLMIVYFHSEHRCPTCLSIEDNTRKTLKTYFSKEVKEGNITLQVLNIEEKKNEKLVEKYQADGSGLFLTYKINGKEQTSDLTNFAFKYSRNQPEKFIAGLKEEIEKDLK